MSPLGEHSCARRMRSDGGSTPPRITNCAAKCGRAEREAREQADGDLSLQTLEGRIIAAGDIVQPFSLHYADAIAEDAVDVMGRLSAQWSVEVCYCSVLDQCWVAGQDRAAPAEDAHGELRREDEPVLFEEAARDVREAAEGHRVEQRLAARAERRVKLGLLLAELISSRELKADPEKVRGEIEELASTYQEPEEVINWYYGNQEQLQAVESKVLEDQAVESLLEQATVSEAPCSYQEAISLGQQANNA